MLTPISNCLSNVYSSHLNNCTRICCNIVSSNCFPINCFSNRSIVFCLFSNFFLIFGATCTCLKSWSSFVLDKENCALDCIQHWNLWLLESVINRSFLCFTGICCSTSLSAPNNIWTLITISSRQFHHILTIVTCGNNSLTTNKVSNTFNISTWFSTLSNASNCLNLFNYIKKNFYRSLLIFFYFFSFISFCDYLNFSWFKFIFSLYFFILSVFSLFNYKKTKYTTPNCCSWFCSNIYTFCEQKNRNTKSDVIDLLFLVFYK